VVSFFAFHWDMDSACLDFRVVKMVQTSGLECACVARRASLDTTSGQLFNVTRLIFGSGIALLHVVTCLPQGRRSIHHAQDVRMHPTCFQTVQTVLLVSRPRFQYGKAVRAQRLTTVRCFSSSATWF